MATNFQPPKGTRDFYPAEMAVRRYIEDTWRKVSLRHGFVEVDGPTFEFLDLYKVKSGDEIVDQLFCLDSKPDKEGKVDHFALRPEFTPTVARMIAAKANSLAKPIKWFSIPRCYRGENVQKGRLREFIQWNVDIFGGETPDAKRQFDLESAALLLDCCREFGLTNSDIQLLWNDRSLVENLFTLAGVPRERFPFAFYLLDRIAKLVPEQRQKLYAENPLTDREKIFFEKLANGEDPLTDAFWTDLATDGGGVENYRRPILESQERIDKTLAAMGLAGFAKYDASIVRGLAYYTGFVYELADARGQNRAVAGGGRYDKLIEMFSGPALPAVGFGMGDVVIAILLEELGRMPASLKTGTARADVFVINALEDPVPATKLLAELRTSAFDPATNAITRSGLAAVTSYKTSKNIGKLLQDASASGARVAIILAPTEFSAGKAKLKDLSTREEKEVLLSEVRALAEEILRT
jgi:histidyl-tRNA synthetase